MGKLSIMKREKRRVVIVVVVVYKVTIGFALSKKKVPLKVVISSIRNRFNTLNRKKRSSFVGQGRWVSP